MREDLFFCLRGSSTFKGLTHLQPHELCGHRLGSDSFLLLSHQVLWLAVEVVLGLMLLASVAFVSPAEVVVLAAAAHPTTIGEVKLLFLEFFFALSCSSCSSLRSSGCGFFEIVDHNLVDLHGWKL